MNKNSMNLGQYNNRHVIKHVTLKINSVCWNQNGLIQNSSYA